MKRCPECRRDYYDDSLMYCLDDGVKLLEGPALPETQTAILPGDAETRDFPDELATGPDDPRGAARPRRHPWPRFALFAAVLGAVLLAGIYAYRYFGRDSDQIGSIAVMPFANVGNDPTTEYLSDGISEALINSLTELRQLRVVARATAFRYKGQDIEPKVIGRELNVRAVLMGTVKQVGNSLDVQVDLVDADTGAQIWGHDYVNKGSDPLSVKNTIASEIIDKLRVRLSGDDQQKFERRETKNSEAYKHYLRGLYLQNQRTADTLHRALDEFQQAIANDHNYALGYVGLADTYTFLEQITGVPASESLPKARVAADRALQIDDSLAEAHTSSAKIYEYLWRWPEAEREYRHAISLNPNYPRAHQWFALLLRSMRRFDEARSEIKRAQELDPLSSIIAANAAFASLIDRDFDSVIEQDKKVIDLDNTFWVPHIDSGWAYLKLGRIDAATGEFERAVEISGRASIPLGALGNCYAMSDRRAEALAVARELEERYDRQETIGFNVATVYSGLGDADRAFAWLEKDFQRHSSQLPYITWWPNFEDLRGDPRYADLVRRMGLPQ